MFITGFAAVALNPDNKRAKGRARPVEALPLTRSRQRSAAAAGGGLTARILCRFAAGGAPSAIIAGASASTVEQGKANARSPARMERSAKAIILLQRNPLQTNSPQPDRKPIRPFWRRWPPLASWASPALPPRARRRLRELHRWDAGLHSRQRRRRGDLLTPRPKGCSPTTAFWRWPSAQPEFKTPIWDYIAGLVDDERVADGKAAMAREARALAKAEARFGVDKYVLAAIWGVEFEFRPKTPAARPLVQSLATLACESDVRPAYYPRRADGGAEDRRPRRHPARQAHRLLGGRLRPDAVHAFDLPAARGRSRRLRGATSSTIPPPRSARPPITSAKSGWRTGEPWGFEVKLPEALFRPSGPQGASADGGLGGARDRASTAGRSARATPACCCRPGRRGPAFLVTHNFDVDLFLQRRRILHARHRLPRPASPAARAS